MHKFNSTGLITTEEPDFQKYLAEGASSPMAVIDGEFIVVCNSSMSKMLKVSAEQNHQLKHPLNFSPVKQKCGKLSSTKAEKMRYLAFKNKEHRFIWTIIDNDKQERELPMVLLPFKVGSRNYLHLTVHDNRSHYIDYNNSLIARVLSNNVNDAVVIADLNGCILEVNSSYTDITGYQSIEVLGKTVFFSIAEKLGAEQHKKLWDIVSLKGEWQGQLHEHRKNGQLYKQQVCIKTVKGIEGNIENYVITFYEEKINEEYEKRLKKLAYYDLLTDLPNRQLISKFLNRKISLNSEQENFSLLYIDIDNFKSINEAFGHQSGDLVLKLVASRLKSIVKKQDLLGRVSSDEFILVVDKQIGIESLTKLTQRIISVFKSPMRLENISLRLSLSIGISSYPQHGKSLNDIWAKADLAMSHAKEAIGSHFRIYDDVLEEEYRLESFMSQEIEQALAKRSFIPYFQPKLDLKTNSYCGAEVLARWFKEDESEVRTYQFITYAEKSGQIKAISEMIMGKAINSVAHTTDEIQDKRISLNLSGTQLSSVTLYDDVLEILNEANLPNEYLELEVTESKLIESFDIASQSLIKLRKLGVKVALDDFGTGYSSFSYLKKFPIDTIKIDKCFIDDIAMEPIVENESYVIVKGIIQLAHALGLEVVAEGIEHKEQLELLRELGCDKIQGYCYAKPMPFGELSSFIHCAELTA